MYLFPCHTCSLEVAPHHHHPSMEAAWPAGRRVGLCTGLGRALRLSYTNSCSVAKFVVFVQVVRCRQIPDRLFRSGLYCYPSHLVPCAGLSCLFTPYTSHHVTAWVAAQVVNRPQQAVALPDFEMGSVCVCRKSLVVLLRWSWPRLLS